MNKIADTIKRMHFCANCGIVMVRAEWITGDYCWGCRAVLGKNWKESGIPEKLYPKRRGDKQ